MVGFNTIPYFFLIVQLQNGISSEIGNLNNEIWWNKQLINDGTCYKFFGNNINDIIYPYKIISFNINEINGLTQDALENILLYIPKDLHQAKLCINLSGSTTNNLIYNLSGFYNGKIQIYNKNENYSKSRFNIINCETVDIHNIYLNNNYYSLASCPIKLNNVESVLISNSRINNIITNDQYKNLINSYSNYSYKVDILSSANTLYKYGTLIEIDNSNVILLNNEFNQKYTQGSLKNFVHIIAKKNSKVVSKNNNFYFSNNKLLNKRPIIFYSGYNSVITAIDNYSVFNNNKELLSQKISGMIWNSALYGYAIPGAIFNHCHKKHILTVAEVSR